MFKRTKLKKVSNPFKSSKKAEPASSSTTNSPTKTSTSKTNVLRSANISDLTASSSSKMFNPRELYSFGFTGKVITMAFDFTQSLLALATETGELRIYGEKQVEVVIPLENKIPIVKMKFVKGIYLIAVDAKDTILVISLYSKKVLTTVFSPNRITCMEVDPSLDWIFFGLQSGTVMIYDIDRNQFSNMKIENLQKAKFFPKDRLSPVVSIQWNPRDIGTVLISYEWVTVTYSLIDGDIKQSFIYDLPPFSPGGNPSMNVDKLRRPKVIQSLYHPNSLHILTAHEDNSLVFWDANTGELIQARSLLETDVNIPQAGLINNTNGDSGPQILSVDWICQSDPEYTSLVIATGTTTGTENIQDLTMLDLGGTPLYSLTSYEGMSKYYSVPVQERHFPLVNKSKIRSLLPIPKASPYFHGCHDPSFILILLDDGEIETLLYPSGLFTSKASLFPQNISWIRPVVTMSMAVAVPSKLWLGMMSSNSAKDSLLKGGSLTKRPMRKQELRSVIVTGHTNGSLRIYDASHGELDDSSVFDVNVSQILNKSTSVSITHASFATETLELAVCVESGDVVLFKFEVNKFYDPENKNKENNLALEFGRFSLNDHKEILIDVKSRASRYVKQGFMPITAVHAKRGRISAVTNSNVGFVGIAYEDGSILVIDRRGPAVIFMDNIRNISGIRGQNITAIEFSIMEYGQDGYSSILMFCGTNNAEILVYRVFPESNGRFAVEFIEFTKTNDAGSISKIDTFAKANKISCSATISRMQDLSKGIPIPGYVCISGQSDIRIIKPGKSKESHRSFKFPLAASGLSHVYMMNSKGQRELMIILSCLLINGDIKILSVPDLKELKSSPSLVPVHSAFMNGSSVLKNGEIAVRSGKFKMSLISLVNDPKSEITKKSVDTDTLYNPNLRIKYRPQVNTLQWARGTVTCTPEQLDILLGGERRPASKYQESLIAKGTLTVKPTDKPGASSPQLYKKPVRHGRSSHYGVLKSVSRAVETHWDVLEDNFNDYATAVGEGMNDAVEQTGKDLVKGSLGF
ncbi:putative Rab GTPase-binding protein SRO77 NDAI_0E04620 [Naumovozyma dairenensis CBS 421]|uniref:Lethal giant larvae (Lgl)-like C-terminal domain-containing protein n=1 Tax=Naumovozyma dairenensis (strain ATCC 10597 / BCRC 20456 / CBS 421 / NBRC 0211 / NRRL Y-12639) TaxID=1071378 RepID=G0WC09_NAUDC|nr:hypothetical protein NDAI_0E04620 [Naumovozyma dairenensis CBS 421]CCD25279.1 hypothetical protein NDAI_0E04620 [Naumovozyma dairenensis CBS 421]